MDAPLQPYKDKLAGKSILVIGGTSGIGFSVASLCLAHKAHVAISSSNPDRLATAVKRLKGAYPDGDVQGYQVDLRAAAVEESVKALFKQVGKVDHVVHTAGDTLSTSKLADVTVDKIQKAGEIRFVSTLIVAKYAQEYLNPGPASSLTLTSGTVAERPHEAWSIIASYAAGLYGMTRNLALDMKPLRVNLVSPGGVDTELWDGMSAEAKSNFVQATEKRVPTGVFGKPEDVAEAYLHAMKDHNMTGVVLKTDSGAGLV